MRKSNVILYLTIAIIGLSIFTIPIIVKSNNPTAITPFQAWQDAEQRLGNAIAHLIRIEAARDNAHDVWSDNREDIRDTKIGALSGIQRDPFSALSTAIATAGLLWSDISDDLTATEGLSTGISALMKQLRVTKARERDRNDAYKKYVEWFWQHNSPSGNNNPKTKIWVVPDVEFDTYTCGGCQVTSYYPEEHRVLCKKEQDPVGCNRTYYTCVTGEGDIHQPRGCIAPIKYYGQYFYKGGGTSEEVYLFSVECWRNFRGCKRTKAHHEYLIRIYVNADGSIAYKRTTARNYSKCREFLFWSEEEKSDTDQEPVTPQQQVTPQEQQTTPSTSPSAPNPDPPPEPQTPEKELCKWCKMYGIKDGCGGSCIN